MREQEKCRNEKLSNGFTFVPVEVNSSNCCTRSFYGHTCIEPLIHKETSSKKKIK